MKFIRTINPPESGWEKAYVLGFDTLTRILVEETQNQEIRIPCLSRSDFSRIHLSDSFFAGYLDGIPVFSGTVEKEPDEAFTMMNLRKVFNKVSPEIWNIIGYARGIRDCRINASFCGKCGKKTVPKTDEHAMFCNECRLTFYPRISPAIITAVVKEDRLLLARGVNFPNKKMFSVLAGFVDAQENLEECLQREVFEETGIRVKNIRYFGSQPWPFPDSLMIGFTAEYAGGNLVIDQTEIAEAGWFRADELPMVPQPPTLSGQLIQWFVDRYGG